MQIFVWVSNDGKKSPNEGYYKQSVSINIRNASESVILRNLDDSCLQEVIDLYYIMTADYC